MGHLEQINMHSTQELRPYCPNIYIYTVTYLLQLFRDQLSIEIKLTIGNGKPQGALQHEMVRKK